MSEHTDVLAENPLSESDERLIDGNANLDGDDCPHQDCDRTVDVVDLTDSRHLFVWHTDDTIGDADGCEIPPRSDPTIGE